MTRLRSRSRSVAAVTALVCVLGFANAASASVLWQRDLKSAVAESEKTGKPILIQFTASWCGYCHKMLRETYPDKEIAARINEYFVPLVLDADDNEKVVDALGVEAFPTAVIISPQLDVIGRIQGFYRASQFTQKLAPFCKSAQPVARTAVLSGDDAPKTRPVSAEQLAPPVAFDGLCLVSMLDDRKMQKGDARITHQFKGVTLQFASRNLLEKFLAKPERYWPVADGNCPIAILHNEEHVAGNPAMTAVYHDQLILFRDLAHRDEFAKQPQHFMQKLTAVLAEAGQETRTARR